MRMPHMCFDCFMEEARRLGTDEGIDLERHSFYLGHLTDDNVYVATCPRGHTAVVVVRNPKHEVLFESGAVALLCGFHREAAASFYAALERFYEFATHVLWEAAGVPATEAARCWGPISKRSESQFGAFLAAYLAVAKTAWTPPENLTKLSGVRNDIVHSGEIPTRDAVIAFARKVFRLVEDVFNQLLIVAAPALHEVNERRVRASLEAADRLVKERGLPPPNPANPKRVWWSFMLAGLSRDLDRDFDTRLNHLSDRLRIFVPGIDPTADVSRAPPLH